MTEYIQKQDLEDCCIYWCNARNFNVGIWFQGKMYGLRRKWGDEFVDTEYHWDDGAENCGTCKPIKKLSASLKERLHPSMFDITNWRGSLVLHDILYAVEAMNLDMPEEI